MPTADNTSKPLDRSTQRLVLIAAILGSSMAFIDGTVVNVALPALQTYFQANAAQVQWVVESYALFLAALLLVGGGLGDLYGRKKIFLAGTALFGAASIWCGLSTTISMLITARAAQGIGAAFLVPGSLALISASYPAETRGKAIGTWSGFTAITAAIGPLIGGSLVQHASWRWVFFINIPLALATVLISLRIPETHSKDTSKPLDWPGAILATCGLGATTFALIESSTSPRPILWIGLLGFLFFAIFLYVEARAANPMVPLPLFRSRDFSGANLITLFLYAALGGALYYLPLNLMQVQHYPPAAAGAALLPLILLLFLLSRWSGGLVAKYGARRPLAIGPIISALGFALLLRPSVGGSYWLTFFPAILVLGFGLSVSVAPLTTVVMNAVPEDRAGSASGVNNAVSRVASLLAIALFGLLITPLFTQSLENSLRSPAIPEQTKQQIVTQRNKLAAIETPDPNGRKAIENAFVYGFRGVVLASVGLSVLASIAAAIFISSKKTEEQSS